MKKNTKKNYIKKLNFQLNQLLLLLLINLFYFINIYGFII